MLLKCLLDRLAVFPLGLVSHTLRLVSTGLGSPGGVREVFGALQCTASMLV